MAQGHIYIKVSGSTDQFSDTATNPTLELIYGTKCFLNYFKTLEKALLRPLAKQDVGNHYCNALYYKILKGLPSEIDLA
jgi:hypothetical protein